MTQATLEVVVYSAKPGVSPEAIRKAVEMSTAELQSFPGYLSRELAYSVETGQWIDIVRWRDRASAHAAVSAFGLQPRVTALNDVIDLSRIRFMHLESVLLDRKEVNGG